MHPRNKSKELTPEFLKLNHFKLIRCLQGIISPESINSIKKEAIKNIKSLLVLSNSHMHYAKKALGKNIWRQKISRSYYACYSASKAIRLAHNGHYSTGSEDHEKIGDLPDDFPSMDIWKDFLTKFRADRNISDYDHNAKVSSLEMAVSQYIKKSELFIKEVENYLNKRGIL